MISAPFVKFRRVPLVFFKRSRKLCHAVSDIGEVIIIRLRRFQRRHKASGGRVAYRGRCQARIIIGVIRIIRVYLFIRQRISALRFRDFVTVTSVALKFYSRVKPVMEDRGNLVYIIISSALFFVYRSKGQYLLEAVFALRQKRFDLIGHNL